MRKLPALILALSIMLLLCACGKSNTCTCDCPQCAQCEEKTQNTVTAEETIQEASVATEAHSGNKVVFPEPVLLAEDGVVRVELISFFEEDSPYQHIGKYVTMKFTNKADYEIGVRLENLAVDDTAADCSYPGAQIPILLSGETTTYYFEIMDPFQNALDSVEQLYTLKGRFKVTRRRSDGVHTDPYEIPFSVKGALGGETAASKAASLENSSYLGKWKVTEITFADENISSRMEEDAELWENFFKGMLGSFENVYFVFTESGDCYYHTDNGTNTGRWAITETGMKAGEIVFTAEDNKLVCERDGYLLYWEKVSDSQAFPET